MPTLHDLQDQRALDRSGSVHELPPLTTVDRLALRLGLALILWGRHHAEHVDRADRARAGRPDGHLAASRRDVFERRAAAGPMR